MSGNDAYSLRTARPDDAAAVSALLEASYPQLLAPDYDPQLLAAALPIITKASPRLLESGTYHVVETDNGRIVGCGGWTLEAPGGGERKPGVGHIRHFAIHPLWTRRGLGRLLLNRCIAEAKAQGLQTLECYSTLTAESFYRAAGFSTVAPMTFLLSPTVALPGTHMRLSVA